MRRFDLIDLFFSLAEIFIVIAYTFRNMLVLRIITVVGMATYILGAFLAGYSVPGMKALIGFSALAMCVNLVQIFKLALDKLTILLPEDIRWLYQQMFSSFTTTEFGKIYGMALKKKYAKGQLITLQDQPVTELIAINSGSVSIIQDDQIVAQIGPGFFVGEMSFLTGKVATTTTKADEDTECIIWKQDILHQLTNKNPQLHSKLIQEISFNLIKKITKWNSS